MLGQFLLIVAAILGLLMRFTSLASCLLATILIPQVAVAQTSQRQPSSAQLTRQFNDGFLKGCVSGKTEGVSNQRGYCNCMVSSYNSRYDGKTLSAISQIANASGQGGPALVNLMMQPEAKKCVARF